MEKKRKKTGESETRRNEIAAVAAEKSASGATRIRRRTADIERG